MSSKYFTLLKSKQKYSTFRNHTHSASFFTSAFASLGGARLTLPASNYIVTFKKGTSQSIIDEEIKKAEDAGATVTHRYTTSILGYAVSVPDDAVNAFDFTHPSLDFVEADGEVTTQGQALLTK